MFDTRPRWLALFATLLLVTLSCQASASQRIALVIGNAAYAESPLYNPVNDAIAIDERLTALGFEVVRVTDADLRSMQSALVEFTRRIEDDATALVFYAGHGVQANGRNYLVPIDARLENESSLRFEALELNDVLEELEYSRSKLNLVVLDACRNNPFLRRFRGGSRGADREGPRQCIGTRPSAMGSAAAAACNTAPRRRCRRAALRSASLRRRS